MRVVPVNDYVLVKKIKTTQTKSGIILPERDDEAIHKCEVVEVAGSSQVVSKGDVIIIDKYAGKKLNIEGEQLTLVKANDIVAKLRNE